MNFKKTYVITLKQLFVAIIIIMLLFGAIITWIIQIALRGGETAKINNNASGSDMKNIISTEHRHLLYTNLLNEGLSWIGKPYQSQTRLAYLIYVQNHPSVSRDSLHKIDSSLKVIDTIKDKKLKNSRIEQLVSSKEFSPSARKNFGTDCSGYTSSVYELATGIKISTNSAAQWTDSLVSLILRFKKTVEINVLDTMLYKNTLNKKDSIYNLLLPGDILCFGSSTQISHVALYVGDRENYTKAMIHSPNSNDNVKVVNNFLDIYIHNGNQKFLGAKRIIF